MLSRRRIPIPRRPCEQSVRQKPLFRYRWPDYAVLTLGITGCGDENAVATVVAESPAFVVEV